MTERHVKTIKKDGEKISEEIKSIQQRNDLIYRNNSLRVAPSVKDERVYAIATKSLLQERKWRFSSLKDYM